MVTNKKTSSSKTLRVTQIASDICKPDTQTKTLRALGLKKIGSTVEHADNPSIRGQIFKVKHLVKVEEI